MTPKNGDSQISPTQPMALRVSRLRRIAWAVASTLIASNDHARTCGQSTSHHRHAVARACSKSRQRNDACRRGPKRRGRRERKAENRSGVAVSRGVDGHTVRAAREDARPGGRLSPAAARRMWRDSHGCDTARFVMPDGVDHLRCARLAGTLALQATLALQETLARSGESLWRAAVPSCRADLGGREGAAMDHDVGDRAVEKAAGSAADEPG